MMKSILKLSSEKNESFEEHQFVAEKKQFHKKNFVLSSTKTFYHPQKKKKKRSSYVATELNH